MLNARVENLSDHHDRLLCCGVNLHTYPSQATITKMSEDERIEDIQDAKNNKYMIMIGTFCVSTILYIVPFSLCIIDIATNNRFGSYTILIITSIYFIMNLINLVLYIRIARYYNEQIREYREKQSHAKWAQAKQSQAKQSQAKQSHDHIIINMPHAINGQSK